MGVVGGEETSQRHFPKLSAYRPGQSLLHIPSLSILEKEVEGRVLTVDSISAAILTWNQGILIAELGLSPNPIHVQVWIERESYSMKQKGK